MLKKLIDALTSRPPTFDTWEAGIKELSTLNVKQDARKVHQVLLRLSEINQVQGRYKPGWVLYVGDDGHIAALDCFREGQSTADKITVSGGGWVLPIRAYESDIRKHGASKASERHFVEYLRELCRTQLR